MKGPAGRDAIDKVLDEYEIDDIAANEQCHLDTQVLAACAGYPSATMPLHMWDI